MDFDWRRALGQGGPSGFTLGYDYGAPGGFGGAPNTGSPFIGQPITRTTGGIDVSGGAPTQPIFAPTDDDEGGFLDGVTGALGGLWGAVKNNPDTVAQLIGTGLAYKGARDDRNDERQDRQRVLRERAQSGQNIGQLLARGFGG